MSVGVRVCVYVFVLILSDNVVTQLAICFLH